MREYPREFFASIRVFELPYWAEADNSFIDDEDFYACVRKKDPEITPVFNRPGLYWDRRGGFVWIETNRYGVIKAFAFDEKEISYRKYSLALLNHNPLRDVEREALITLEKSRSIAFTRTAKKLLQMDREWNSIRDVRRGTRRIFMK